MADTYVNADTAIDSAQSAAVAALAADGNTGTGNVVHKTGATLATPTITGANLEGQVLTAPIMASVTSSAGVAAGTTPAKQSDGTFVGLSAFSFRQTACPAFSAGAAGVAMGTLKASECLVVAGRALAQNSTLTLSVTDAVTGLWSVVTCRALTLGYTLAIANGGPAGTTLYTFPAALTVPQSRLFYFDGTNWTAQGLVYVEAIG